MSPEWAAAKFRVSDPILELAAFRVLYDLRAFDEMHDAIKGNNEIEGVVRAIKRKHGSPPPLQRLHCVVDEGAHLRSLRLAIEETGVEIERPKATDEAIFSRSRGFS